MNDPVGIKALLEQLRASQAWQQLGTQQSSSQDRISESAASTSSDDPPPAASSPTNTVSRVAELLAQLKNPASSPGPPPREQAPVERLWNREIVVPPTAAAVPQQPNLRSCTFQTALSLVSRLGDDPAFLSSIRELRAEQNVLEQRLWADRERLCQKYADKVKAAQTRATLTGGGISKHEATMLQDAYQRGLRKYDQERVLPAWEGLVSRQQARLESLSVPSMFVTSDPKDRERQSQIIQVLVGLAGATS